MPLIILSGKMARKSAQNLQVMRAKFSFGAEFWQPY